MAPDIRTLTCLFTINCSGTASSFGGEFPALNEKSDATFRKRSSPRRRPVFFDSGGKREYVVFKFSTFNKLGGVGAPQKTISVEPEVGALIARGAVEWLPRNARGIPGERVLWVYNDCCLHGPASERFVFFDPGKRSEVLCLKWYGRIYGGQKQIAWP